MTRTLPIIARMWTWNPAPSSSGQDTTEVILLFPTELGDRDGEIESFTSGEGWLSAYYQHILDNSRPATPEEAAPLVAEWQRAALRYMMEDYLRDEGTIQPPNYRLYQRKARWMDDLRRAEERRQKEVRP